MSDHVYLDAARDLFFCWEERGIEYCHWKSNEHLKEALNGNSDMDVLVDLKRQIDIEELLHQNGYLKMLSQFGSRYPLVEDWIGFDQSTGKIIHLHLYYSLITGHIGLKEYNLPWTRDALETRIWNDEYNVYTIDPALEIVLLASRIALKSKLSDMIGAHMGQYSLSEHDKKEFEYLLLKADLYETKNKERFFGKEDAILDLLTTHTYDCRWFLQLRKSILNRMKKCRRNIKFFTLKRGWYFFAIHARAFIKKYMCKTIITKKTLKNGEGLIVAFIGQDGAGKSYISNEVVKWLKWKIDAERFYLGSGEQYRSKLFSIANRLKRKKSKTVCCIRAFLLIIGFVRLSKHKYYTMQKIKKYTNKGGVAILDRFPQIQFNGINDGLYIYALKDRTDNVFLIKVLELLGNIEKKYIMKALEVTPDLTIKLTLPVEESLRRKPQENRCMVEKKHEIMDKLLVINGKCEEVPADMNLRDEIVRIHNFVWQVYKEKGKS